MEDFRFGVWGLGSRSKVWGLGERDLVLVKISSPSCSI